MKTSRIFIMALIILLLIPSVAIAKEKTNVKISLNGVQLDIPSSYGYPYIDYMSRTIIPVRIISERLGHDVEWNELTEKVIIDGEISITIGEKIVKTSKGEITMDTKAILKDGRTYVPLRFVVEALGYEVSHNRPNSSNNFQHIIDIAGQANTPIKPMKPLQPTQPKSPTQPVSKRDGSKQMLSQAF